MDNFFTGNKQNVEHLRDHASFELMRHDVIDPFKVEVTKSIIWPARHRLFNIRHEPIKTIKTSVMGAINCLGLAVVGARILQASTSEVYGDPEVSAARKGTVGMLTPSLVSVMMKENAVLKLCFLITIGKIRWIPEWFAFSTLSPRMAQTY